MSQIPLPLPAFQPSYTRDRFLTSPSNEAACRAGEAWRQSDEPALIICGPAGAGKTHLAHIIAAEFDNAFIDCSNWTAPPDVELIIFDNLPAAEPARLLAVLSDLEARGRRALLAGVRCPHDWAGGLEDLRTRLEAMPRASLSEPDEALIRAVIRKEFNDRQLEVGAAVVDFSAPRMPLTFAAAHAFVAHVDQAGLEERRNITIPLAQKIIDNLFEGDGTA